MINNAVFFPPRANPAGNSSVSVTGDENGVMLTIHARNKVWELYLPTEQARKFTFDIHRAVMDSINAGYSDEIA